jgi:hypothetical protein
LKLKNGETVSNVRFIGPVTRRLVLNKKKLMEPRTTKMHLAKLGIKHSELDF